MQYVCMGITNGATPLPVSRDEGALAYYFPLLSRVSYASPVFLCTLLPVVKKFGKTQERLKTSFNHSAERCQLTFVFPVMTHQLHD